GRLAERVAPVGVGERDALPDPFEPRVGDRQLQLTAGTPQVGPEARADPITRLPERPPNLGVGRALGELRRHRPAARAFAPGSRFQLSTAGPGAGRLVQAWLDFVNAAMRFFISSGDTSSTCVPM